MNRVYLLLGSNMGDRAAILSRACAKLSERLLPTIMDGANDISGNITISDESILYRDSCKVVNREDAMRLLMPMFVMSDMIETDPVGFECDAKFINMVVSAKTILDPRSVLRVCQEIETELGRNRDSEGERFDAEGKRIYHSRPIDIDILFCERFDSVVVEKATEGEGNMGDRREFRGRMRGLSVEIDDPDLIVPHKELPNRPFAQFLLKQTIERENY